jgi:hypothetical protein
MTRDSTMTYTKPKYPPRSNQQCKNIKPSFNYFCPNLNVNIALSIALFDLGKFSGSIELTVISTLTTTFKRSKPHLFHPTSISCNSSYFILTHGNKVLRH